MQGSSLRVGRVAVTAAGVAYSHLVHHIRRYRHRITHRASSSMVILRTSVMTAILPPVVPSPPRPTPIAHPPTSFRNPPPHVILLHSNNFPYHGEISKEAEIGNGGKDDRTDKRTETNTGTDRQCVAGGANFPIKFYRPIGAPWLSVGNVPIASAEPRGHQPRASHQRCTRQVTTAGGAFTTHRRHPRAQRRLAIAGRSRQSLHRCPWIFRRRLILLHMSQWRRLRCSRQG